MLLDVRTYTCRPGTIKAHLELYEKYGFAAQKRHLGEPLAYLITETGPQNTFTHIWVYEDADPEWQAYLKKSAEAGYLVAQENRLMTPASFAPIKR